MQEINLYDLLRHYAKNWTVIAICTLLGLFLGHAYNAWVQVPAYKSDASLLVVSNPQANSVEKTTIINNYMELLKSRRVAQPVIDKLKLDQSYDEFIGSVSTNNDKDTEVIKLSVSTNDPERSKQIAEATIDSFKGEVNTIYAKDTIKTIDNANLPTKPSNVRTTVQLMLFMSAGFLASIIGIFFVYDYRLNQPVKAAKKSPKAKKVSAAKTVSAKPKKPTAKSPKKK